MRGDIDGDGALDLLVTSIAGPAAALPQRRPAPRALADRSGVRSRFCAATPMARRSRCGPAAGWVQYLNPGSSYLCSNDPRVHFGLGPVDRVDALEVVWPDGSEELFAGTAADRIVVVSKGKGRAANPSQPAQSEKTAAK